MIDAGTGSVPRRRLPDRTAVLLTLAAWLPMLGWYAALRPGLMSADSLTVWQQATAGDWVDLHPPVYTAGMWVSSRLVGGPGLLTLGQSLLLAASIVGLARSVRRLGAPPAAVAVAAGLVVLSPMTGLFAVSLWKDVPYTAALLLASARVVDLAAARLRPEAADVRAILRSLTVWLVAVTLLRQNGLIFAAVVLAVLALVLRGRRGSVALAGAVVVLSLVTAKAVVYPLAGVRRSPAQASVAMLLHDVAAVARTDPAVFEPDDRALLGLVAPFETWRESSARFGCSSANWQWGAEFSWGAVEDRAGEYVGLWTEVVRERPRRVVANRLCVGAITWRPDSEGTLYTVSAGVDANPFGLRTRPLVSGLDAAAREVIEATNEPSLQWVLWRGPTWIYAGWAGLLVAGIRRRRPAVLLAGLPGLALPLSVFPFNPAQDARYMFGGVVLGAMLLTLAGSRSGAPAGDDAHEAARTDGAGHDPGPEGATNGDRGDVARPPLVTSDRTMAAVESALAMERLANRPAAPAPPLGRRGAEDAEP